MKTTNKKTEASAPASVRPTSVSKTTKTKAKAGGKGQLPAIDFDQRRQNRALPTPKVLDLLTAKLPDVYAVAEIVGKWVWVQFNDVPATAIRRQLAELGFHWCSARQAWQHPCGIFRDSRAPYDPRKRYGSYFAADIRPA